MSYSPTSIPAVSVLTVDTGVFTVTLPRQPFLGVLLLQRNADTGRVYRGWDNGVTTSTGLQIIKGDASSNRTLIPFQAFNGTHTFYLISDTAGQTVEIEVI